MAATRWEEVQLGQVLPTGSLMKGMVLALTMIVSTTMTSPSLQPPGPTPANSVKPGTGPTRYGFQEQTMPTLISLQRKTLPSLSGLNQIRQTIPALQNTSSIRPLLRSRDMPSMPIRPDSSVLALMLIPPGDRISPHALLLISMIMPGTTL